MRWLHPAGALVIIGAGWVALAIVAAIDPEPPRFAVRWMTGVLFAAFGLACAWLGAALMMRK